MQSLNAALTIINKKGPTLEEKLNAIEHPDHEDAMSSLPPTLCRHFRLVVLDFCLQSLGKARERGLQYSILTKMWQLALRFITNEDVRFITIPLLIRRVDSLAS
jgi:hypothetical protein